MAGNIYLYLSGIPGESTAKTFPNWIDVQDFGVGHAMEVDPDARTGSGGGTSGAADPENFTFAKKMDWASPVLLSCCAVGAIIPRGRVYQCNVVNENVVPVSDYAFGDAIITAVSLSGSGGEIPSEDLEINYGSIIWRYHCYFHDNPSVVVDATWKEWSLISSNPTVADFNTKQIFDNLSAGPGNVPDSMDHSGIDGGTVTFTPGVNIQALENPA